MTSLCTRSLARIVSVQLGWSWLLYVTESWLWPSVVITSSLRHTLQAHTPPGHFTLENTAEPLPFSQTGLVHWISLINFLTLIFLLLFFCKFFIFSPFLRIEFSSSTKYYPVFTYLTNQLSERNPFFQLYLLSQLQNISETSKADTIRNKCK